MFLISEVVLRVRFYAVILLASMVGPWSGAGLSQKTETSRPAALTALSPEQLNQTVARYQKFLKEPPPGTPSASLTEGRTRLATAYFLLHRYLDSLEVLKALETTSTKLPAQAWTVKGLDQLEVNQVSQAVVSLRHAVGENPQSATARLALGDALARSHQMEAAAAEYQRQAGFTPELSDAWYKLGLAHAQLAAEVAQAHVRSSDQAIAQQLHAEELLAKADNLNAARMLFRIARETPIQPDIHADLGAALLGLGYAKAAADQFREELTRNPESPKAWLGMAESSALGGHWEEVKKDFEYLGRTQPLEFTRLLQSPPAGIVMDAGKRAGIQAPQWFASSSVGALWQAWVTGSREVTRVSFDEPAESRCTVEKANRSMPAGVWLPQGCYESLATELGRATRLSISAQAKLAEAEFRLERYQSALHTAKLLRARDPQGGWGLYWLSKAHDAVAEECFLKLGTLNPDSARVHQILAEHYRTLQDYPQAKTEYDKAIRLAPASPEAHLGLGIVFSRTGQWKDAEIELKKTLEMSPQSDFARYQLGHVYLEESRWDAAIDQLRQVPQTSTTLLSTRLDLAQAEANANQTSAAVQDLVSIATLDQDGEVYFRLAPLYRKLGEEAEAREALAKFKHLRARSLEADKDELGALANEQDSGNSATPY